MKNRRWLWVAAPLVCVIVTGLVVYNTRTGNAQPAAGNGAKGKPASETLPIKQVVLFNSGVGYFQREGEIDGNVHTPLSFSASDINAPLKSLVLQDSKGRVGTVNYDSSDPIDKILRSFALDLTGNPTFGQILNQARGEKIEVVRADKKEGATTKVTGVIVGLEVQKKPAGKEQVIETEILNLNNPTTGLQSIPMDQVVSVRFLNPTLESEFQRALSVLAASHDTQKKTVSVGFSGEGKRQVRVGYVVERPIWKTSYRLRVDNNDKVSLQGWALVENTSDDDWNGVRMVLVSGKPISFKMNLYDPIYIPRPFVEPEVFASLRPPVYGGAMTPDEMKRIAEKGNLMPGQMMGMPGMGVGQMPMPQMPGMPMAPPGRALNAFQQQDLQNLQKALAEGRDQNKLTYDELQRRRAEQAAQKADAKKVGSSVTGFNFKEGIQSVANADEVGDYFQYAIKDPISLPRQKSAMLPIIDQTIEGQKVSIFNESVHVKFPLLGLKIKNTSGQPLTQGPITVYDAGVFGGDTRILDVQPNEERLLSYALDQSTEVKTTIKQAPSPDLIFRIGSDQLSARYYVRETKTYIVKNRSTHDRTLIVEHPIRKDWKLFEPKKPIEQTRDLYRFQVAVPAGKTISYEVVEDMPRVDNFGPQPSYAVANGINIKVETTTEHHKLTGLKIAKGFLLASYKHREQKAYFVQNLSDMDRTFTVDHVVRPGWVRLDEKNQPQKGPEVHRFKLAIEKGKTGQQSVREERDYVDAGVLLKNLSETQLKAFLNNPVASADVKAAFEKALAYQGKIIETMKQIAETERQLQVVTVDHTRVRENLKIVPPSSEHYKTFLEKFVAQDKQIESFQQQIRTLTATLQAHQREYDQWLAKLDAE